MREVVVKLFKFDELTEETKWKAIKEYEEDEYYIGGYFDDEWGDCDIRKLRFKLFYTLGTYLKVRCEYENSSGKLTLEFDRLIQPIELKHTKDYFIDYLHSLEIQTPSGLKKLTEARNDAPFSGAIPYDSIFFDFLDGFLENNRENNQYDFTQFLDQLSDHLIKGHRKYTQEYMGVKRQQELEKYTEVFRYYEFLKNGKLIDFDINL